MSGVRALSGWESVSPDTKKFPKVQGIGVVHLLIRKQNLCPLMHGAELPELDAAAWLGPSRLEMLLHTSSAVLLGHY